jgi:hypothetical protein
MLDDVFTVIPQGLEKLGRRLSWRGQEGLDETARLLFVQSDHSLFLDHLAGMGDKVLHGKRSDRPAFEAGGSLDERLVLSADAGNKAFGLFFFRGG